MEEVGEFDAADGVNALLERENAINAPLGVGEVLGEFFFTVGGGAELGFETSDMFLLLFDVIGGQQDGAAGERRADGVVGGFGFSCFARRTRRELGVGLIGGDLCGGGHKILAFGLNASTQEGENELLIERFVCKWLEIMEKKYFRNW
ncbi:MAG TPA: hypothetical protein VG168_11250 [Bryobacteraceae bacterium]|nr:hypothetical protein [Bryobacteraceae bacterium]